MHVVLLLRMNLLPNTMIHLVALFTTFSILIMFLACKQQKPRDKYGIACGILFATLAITSTAQLQGTLFFPAAAFALALLLGVHHIITNLNGPEGTPTLNLFRQEGCEYHETWIVAAITAGLVSMFRL